MALIYDNNKHNGFLDTLVGIPFMRIALFAAIAGVTFLILGIKFVSTLLFFMIPIAIIGRIFSFWLCAIKHPVTIFCVTCFFVGLEISIIGGALVAAGGAESVLGSVGAVISMIGGLPLSLAALGFLVRIFIALFIR